MNYFIYNKLYNLRYNFSFGDYFIRRYRHLAGLSKFLSGIYRYRIKGDLYGR